MSYIDPTSREYVEAKEVTFLASAARTATTSSDWIDIGSAHTLRVLLACTALSGTDETLDVSVTTRYDANDASPRTVGSFTQLTAAGTVRKEFAGLNRQVRVTATLGGTDTPSFTAAITGELVG
jgi:hypothetical protein